MTPPDWPTAASAISRGSGQLTKPAAIASQAMATSLLFFRRDVLIQQSPHPLRPPKLQPGVTLGLGVGAPGHRDWPGRRWGAACPFPLAASHAA